MRTSGSKTLSIQQFEGLVSTRVDGRRSEALERRVDRMVANGQLRSSGQRAESGPITVKTWVHVITKKNGTGSVAPWRIKKQIEVMNKSFAGKTSSSAASTPIKFTLAGTTVTSRTKDSVA